MQVLVAPAAFGGALRASLVAAAIGRGLEAAGLEPPDLCPVADGGPGTLEVLLGRLGGETAGASIGGRRVGYALLEDGATALVEAAGSGGVGELIGAAVDAGAEVVLVAVGGATAADAGLAGRRGPARLIALCDERTPAPGEVDWSGSGGGLAGELRDACGAELRSGAQFVLDALDFDARMHAARAVIVGTGLLQRDVLDGQAVAEAATRARQAGVPAHAIVGANDLDRFDARILDLQEILTARTPTELEAAGRVLAARL